MLLPALALLAWQAADRRCALRRAAIALPIAAVWPVFLWIRFSDPILFAHAQHENFGRHLSRGGPFGGVWYGLAAGWNGVRQLFSHGANYFPQATDHPPAYIAALNLEQLAFGVLIVVLGVIAWRRLGAAYASSCSAACCCRSRHLPPTSRCSPRHAFCSGPSRSSSRSRRSAAGDRWTSRSHPSSRCTSGIDVVRWALYVWVA
jgi:hypothetical protein